MGMWLSSLGSRSTEIKAYKDSQTCMIWARDSSQEAYGGGGGAGEKEEGAQEVAIATAGRQVHSGLAMAVGGAHKGLSCRAGRLQ